MMKKNTVLRTIKTVGTSLWWILSVLLIVLVATLLSAHMRGEVPKLFGYSVMNIVSESMEPNIKKGSYILIREADPNEVNPDDVICFYSTDPAIYGHPNTHRVLEKCVAEDGSISFITKGDNSLIPDAVAAEGDHLIGKYVKTLDGLGAMLRFFTENMLAVFGALLATGAALTVGATVLSTKKQQKEKKDQ